MDITAKITALGRLCGIDPEYRDNFGRRRRTSTATTQTLLTAMGIPWEEPALLTQELERRVKPRPGLLEPVVLVRLGPTPGRVALHLWTPTPGLPPRLEVRGKVTGESGDRISWETTVKPRATRTARILGNGFRMPLDLPLPPGLGWGYYDLSLKVKAGGREEAGTARLIVAPAQTYLPDWLAAGRRAWGFNLPLYAVKSQGNWGIGDFADLLQVLTWAPQVGAAFVGVNPLHAPAPRADADPSPYSPTSRLFLNFLYLDLEAVPELSACPAAQALLASQGFRALRRRLKAARLVAYPKVYRLKSQVLALLYKTFQDLNGPPGAPLTPRGQEFARFLAEKGEALTRFGQFCALADFFQESDWRRWPREYRQPTSPAVAAFAREHSREIAGHQYAQWLAAGQLAQAYSQARHQGLPVTLYQDLALGAAAGGFDTWAHQELFARGAAMGAPPDAFNPQGQNWGLPPMVPERLRATGYQLFIDTLRANLPPGGMVRLDHVMGLFRLFWVPQGQAAGQGAYVRYPARELLAILALESVRNRTLIIGEDLGTVAPRIRQDLKKNGVFSYRVFYFERDGGGGFRSPEDYPPKALATVTTHDLPTLAGFWQGIDVALKRRFQLYPKPQQAELDAAAREQELQKLVEALARRGLLPPGFTQASGALTPCPQEVRFGVLEYLAQSEAALLEVRLEEVLGLPQQQNLPGTTKEHPNWRRKLPLSLQRLRQAPEPALLAARLNRYRGRGG